MREGDKRERISFKCNKDFDYSFEKIKLLIKAAYSEISKLSPFDLDYKELMQVLLSMKEAMSNDELLWQVLINTNAAFPAILQGMKSLSTTVTTGVPLKNNYGNPNNGYCNKNDNRDTEAR